MCRLFSFLASAFLTSIICLAGCGEKETVPEKEQPRGYRELLQAYDAGMVYKSAEHKPACCVITFSDNSKLTIFDSAILIHDCTASAPKEVTVSGDWWQVGERILSIRADSSVPDEDAFPVYCYYDRKTLHMYLSNRQHLVFPSVVSDDDLAAEDELARKQSIPVVSIETAGGAGIYDKTNYVRGTITISDPGKLYSDVEELFAPMGIRGRGNSTWGWPKKPWKVKLDEKAEILGMPADKEWALLANYADRTLLRNVVAMKLSEICGFSWTPKMRSVEVYLNDEYQGVYTFSEHKKVSSSRVAIDKKTDFYFEIEENLDETTVWRTSMGVPMMFSEPEVPTAEQFDYVRQLFNDFEKALYSDDVAAYEDYVDVDSFINYYIVQELTKNVDGNFRKSTFLTKEQGKKLEMYHLWDFDLTLGNCGYFDWRVGNGPQNFFIKDFASNCTPGDNWVNLMMRDPAFLIKLKSRWNALMPEFEKIPDFIKEQALYLDQAQKRNFQRWNIRESVDWVMFPSLGSYEKEVDYLIDFYTDRLHWLDGAINDL